MSRPRKKDRGIVLLIVLSMLVLFLLVAVTFVIVSGQYKRAALSQARYRRTGEDPRKLFDIGIKQLLRDTTNERSSLLGHSLLRDLYGTDGLVGVVVSASEQAGGQFVLIHYVAEAGTGSTVEDFYTGRVATMLDTMWHPGFGKVWGPPPGAPTATGTMASITAPFSDDQLTHGYRWNPGPDGRWGNAGVDDNLDGIPDDLWEAGAAGSDDFTIAGNSHAGVGQMVHPGEDGEWGSGGLDDDDDTNLIGVVELNDSDEAGWPGSDDGFTSAPRKSVRIVDSGADTAALGTPASPVLWIRVEAFESDVSTRMLPTKGTRFVINGAPFNGTGGGYDVRHPTANIDAYIALSPGTDNDWGQAGTNDDGDANATTTDWDEVSWPAPPPTPSGDVWPEFPPGIDDASLAAALAPHISKYNGLNYGVTSSPFAGGYDESWDAADFQNMFMSMVPANSSSTSYIIPSFHRPSLINYLVAVSSSTGNAFTSWWNDPTVRSAVIMRPMPWDHPNFTGSNPAFDISAVPLNDMYSYLAGIHPTTGNIANAWDIDNDGDGTPDSIWLDLGLPLISTPDGRRVKPLVAFLIKDLDGKLNLNFHGGEDQVVTQYSPASFVPAGGNVASYAGAAPQALNNQPRGQGFGPAEISLAHLFSTQHANVLSRRYGGDVKPGRRVTTGVAALDDDFLGNVKHSAIPRNWGPLLASTYGMAPDMRGRGFVALDYAGQPMTFFMGQADERLDNPYQISLDGVPKGRLENLPTGLRDVRFTDAEFERVLRWYDVDQNMMNGRLRRTGGNDFDSAVTRGSVTNRSSHLPVPQLIAPGLFGTNATLMGVFNAALAAVPAGARKMQLENMVAFELRHGRLFNVNRPWGNSLDDNGNFVVDEPFEGDGSDDDGDTAVDEADEMEPNGVDDDGDTYIDEPDELFAAGADREQAWTGTQMAAFDAAPFNVKNNDRSAVDSRHARQIYARHLYCLMSLIVSAQSGTVGHDGLGDVPVGGGVTIPETQRAIAQWAINVVDFRDADSIMTPFEYDANPFDADGWDEAIDGNPLTDEAASGTAPDRMLVWGCERPELLLTETLALHDHALEDLDSDPSGEDTTSNPDMTLRDTDFDQRLRPRASAFIEIYNPWLSDDLKKPAEFYYNHTAATPGWSNGVILNKLAPGGSPVWRLAVTATADTDDPDIDPRLGTPAPAITRSVYFTAAGGPTDGESYHTTHPVAPLLPGRYAVVGSSGQAVDAGGAPLDLDGDGQREFVTTLGRRTDAGETSTGMTLMYGSTRRIVLEPNTDVTEHQVQVFENQTTEPVSGTDALPAVAIAINTPRSFSVTDPTPGGYPDMPPGSVWTPGAADNEGAYVPPVDDPTTVTTTETPGTTKFVHLQRLANPLLAYHPLTNPYRTIDSIAIDPVTFHGIESPPPGLANSAKLHTLERGDGTTDRQLWTRRDSPPGDRTGAKANTPANIPTHRYTRQLNHTLGYLNEPYGNRLTSASGVPAQYIGSPDYNSPTTPVVTTPFPWLTWNNRPFVSPQELLIVPASRPSQLLGDYSIAATSGSEAYSTTDAASFGHLLNFFESGGATPAQLYHLFEFLEVPSPYLGTEKWYNPARFTTTTIERTYNRPTAAGPPPPAISFPVSNDMRDSDLFNPANSFRPPFNKMSRFRDPGRVNINTIFDEEVWEGIAKRFPAMDENAVGTPVVWNNLRLSRQGYVDGTPVPSGDLDNLSTTYPTRFGAPFRAGSTAGLMPVASMRQTAAVDVTLLRPNPAAPGTLRPPLFGHSNTTDYRNTTRNPYFRYSGLTRLGNMLTTHSNVYAVWMTIGYFEVEANPAGTDAAHPDGYRLAREVGWDTGEVKRHRAFYLIDRSIPVAFEPGKDHNVEQTILLSRFIE